MGYILFSLKGFLVFPSFPLFLYRRIYLNKGHRRMLLVLFFRFLITNLTFHVMTFQSAVRIIWAILKYKIDADIKEVIIFSVFPRFTFTPYYDPSPPQWEVVKNSMSSFWKFHNHRKGCISVVVRFLLPA